MLIPAICFLTTAQASSEATVIPANASIWVYSHSSDPADETFLRIWGANGRSLPKDIGSAEDFSFAYLRFDLSKLATGTPKSVELVVYNKAPMDVSKGTAVINPLEVHILNSPFDPKTWQFQQSVTIVPDAGILGNGKVVGTPQTFGDVQAQEIDIPISVAKAKSWFDSSNSAHLAFLALASSIDAAAARNGGSGGGFYKIYSATVSQKELRPHLVIKY